MRALVSLAIGTLFGSQAPHDLELGEFDARS